MIEAVYTYVFNESDYFNIQGIWSFLDIFRIKGVLPFFLFLNTWAGLLSLVMIMTMMLIMMRRFNIYDDDVSYDYDEV